MIETSLIRRLFGRKASVLAALVLALAMGNSVAFFSIADTALSHPVEAKDLDQLVVLPGAFDPPGATGVSWWGQAPSLAALTGYYVGWGTLHSGDQFRPVMVTVATTQFFDVFDVRARLGRGFSPYDENPSAVGVAVLSHELWLEAFGASPDALGREIVLDGTALQIVGVMPSEFDFPGRTDLWVAQQHHNGSSSIELGRNGGSNLPAQILRLPLIGRLKPGATVEALSGEISVLFARLQPELAAANIDQGGEPPSVGSLRQAISGDSKPVVILLFGGSVFLLLVGCLNAGNLLLAQSMAREYETAIRRCLGATPWRVASQMLRESTAVAAVGGTFGIALAWWGVGLLRHAGSAQIVGLVNARLLPSAIAFAFVTVVVAALTSGAASALNASRIEPGRSLGGQSHVRSSSLAPHLRKIFAGGQIALAFLLVTGAAMTAKTLFVLLRTDPGFDPNGVIALNVVPPTPSTRPESGMTDSGESRKQLARKLGGTPGGSSSSPEKTAVSQGERKVGSAVRYNRQGADQFRRLVAFNRELLDQFRRLPGVTSVGLVDFLPFGGRVGGWQYLDANGNIAIAEAHCFTVAGDYFRALRIPLLAGRYFNEEGNESGVLIIDQTLASEIWGDKDPVGRSLKVEGEDNPRRVIGVVGDIKFSSLAASSLRFSSAQLYFPASDGYRGSRLVGAVAVVVRTEGMSEDMLAEVNRAVEVADPRAAVYGAAKMSDMIGESVSALGFRGLLLGFFALAAVVLGLLGVYSVASFVASSRRREFAVRLALGGRPSQIVALTLRETAMFVPGGIVVGVFLMLTISKLLITFLPGVKATDPLTMAATAVTLLVIALGAALMPALRASRIDPTRSLRYE